VTDALLSGLLAGYGVAVPVGAIGVLIMGLAARTSLAVGAGAGLGVATADGLYALVAVAGGAAVSGFIRPVAAPLRWTALVVLVGLAARTAWVAWRAHREAVSARPSRLALSTPGRAYAGLLGLTLLNPATMLYFSALVLGSRAGAGRSLGESALFVGAAFAASASWQLLVAAGGSVLGRALSGNRGRLATALVSSAVMVVLAVRLAVTS
jgi:arginine exporter protein ArgO